MMLVSFNLCKNYHTETDESVLNSVEGFLMSKKDSVFQKKVMSWGYRGKEIFKPLNTGRIDEHVACVREWIANIFFYTKNGTTIMIDAGYNYDRLREKMGWLNIDPSSPTMSARWSVTVTGCFGVQQSTSVKLKIAILPVRFAGRSCSAHISCPCLRPTTTVFC